MAIKRIILENFRNHQSFVSDVDADVVFICGENGAGKTSILEAISFFAPGKGLRSVKYTDAINHNTDSWSAHIDIHDEDDELVSVGAKCSNTSRRRLIRVDGKNLNQASHLLNYLRVIWLTPQMDGLLAESKASRRKFLDRLTYNFFPEHAESVHKYELAMRSRMKILKSTTNWDDIWLSQLEKVMADESQNIHSRRVQTIEKIEPYINYTGFAIPKLMLIHDNQSIDEMMSALKAGRAVDAKIGKTLVGSHRADFKILNDTKQLDAAYSSTGEQKSMLISIIIAQAMVLNAIYGAKPVLLLDDILSHIDKDKCTKILSKFSEINGQIWVTGTHIDDMILSKLYKNYVKIDI
jgi:DNA replication and repair protein RecF